MSYFVISKSDVDIVHFGIKRRSGRYPWGSGKRPFQDQEGSSSKRFSEDFVTSFRRKRITAGTKKIEKLKKKYDKQSAKVAKKYHKAEKKTYGLFATPRSATRAMDEARRAKYKSNKTANRIRRIYERMTKRAEKSGLKISKETTAIGKTFIDMIMAENSNMYLSQFKNDSYTMKFMYYMDERED